MPAAITRPLPNWAKWVVSHAGSLTEAAADAFDYAGSLFDGSESSPTEWRRFVYGFEKITDPDNANRTYTSFDVVQNGATVLGQDWDASSTGTAKGILDTMVAAYCTNFMASTHRCFQLKIYKRVFNPPNTIDPDTGRDVPYPDTGPPLNTYGLAFAGGNSPPTMPGQVSVTLTEKTTMPRHWGRNYWPFPTSTLCTNEGLINSTLVDVLAAAANTAYDALQDVNFHMVVPVTQISDPTRRSVRMLLGVTSVQVDNIFDIQRRRRFHSATYRKAYP